MPAVSPFIRDPPRFWQSSTRRRSGVEASDIERSGVTLSSCMTEVRRSLSENLFPCVLLALWSRIHKMATH